MLALSCSYVCVFVCSYVLAGWLQGLLTQHITAHKLLLCVLAVAGCRNSQLKPNCDFYSILRIHHLSYLLLCVCYCIVWLWKLTALLEYNCGFYSSLQLDKAVFFSVLGVGEERCVCVSVCVCVIPAGYVHALHSCPNTVQKCVRVRVYW